MKRKNILMIYADQWRHDQFGSKKSYLPTLDALASESVMFNQHYTQVLPCAPSRASLFTGLYAQTHRVIKNKTPLNARHKTLGHYLRESGYSPTLFGYTDTTLDPRGMHVNDPDRQPGFYPLPGLDVGCHQTDQDAPDWLAHLRSTGLEFEDLDDAYAPDRSRPNATGGAAGHPAKYTADDSDTAYLTNRLMGWQREQSDGWCALLCYLRPHRPTIAPEPYNGLVNPADLDAPICADIEADEAANHPYLAHLIKNGDAAISITEELSGRIADVDEKDWRSIRAIHLALMAEIDANLGRLFQQLKDLGQWDDTLIIFSSDHSEAMFDHYLCSQAAWHDQSNKIPLIVRDPDPQARSFAGTQIEDFTQAVDTIPTLLDWLGRDLPGYLDGASLLPYLHGQTPENWRDHVTWEYNFENDIQGEFADGLGLDREDYIMTVYRDADFKHVFFPGQQSVLIDLNNDPDELKNVAADPAYVQVERDYLARQFRDRIKFSDRILPAPRPG